MPSTPSTETLLVVLFAATAVNLVLALALVLVPRIRRWRVDRGNGRDAVRAGVRGRGGASPGSDAYLTGSGGRPQVAVFGPGSGAVPSDPQTGLDAPSTWARWLHEEDARARRYRRPATVVLVEIDGLDRLVERLGPAAADRLIPPVAATMRTHAREVDRIARLGPARFAAILPETDEVRAINYVERVRTACDLWLAAGAVALRLSMGWAELNPSRSGEAAFAEAEDRLNGERRRHVVVDDVSPPDQGTEGFRPAPAT